VPSSTNAVGGDELNMGDSPLITPKEPPMMGRNTTKMSFLTQKLAGSNTAANPDQASGNIAGVETSEASQARS